jgi:hypothetical protein
VAYARQYAAGVNSPENLALAQKAEASFRKVLELAPGDKAALASLGELVYEESKGPHDRQGQFAKLDEAKAWIERLKAVPPGTARHFTSSASLFGRRRTRCSPKRDSNLHMGAEAPGRSGTRKSAATSRPDRTAVR